MFLYVFELIVVLLCVCVGFVVVWRLLCGCDFWRGIVWVWICGGFECLKLCMLVDFCNVVEQSGVCVWYVFRVLIPVVVVDCEEFTPRDGFESVYVVYRALDLVMWLN